MKSTPRPDPSPPPGEHTWRIVTKPIGARRRADPTVAESYDVFAANAGIVDTHLCLWDSKGVMVHIRANGTFETVMRLVGDDV